MFTDNPFSGLAKSVPPGVMQIFVLVMIALVAQGTLYDMNHKLSARYFFANWRKASRRGKRPIGGGEMVSLAIRTAVVDGLTSGEFCNAKRRIAHLLTMYGFLAYTITTMIMVFRY